MFGNTSTNYLYGIYPSMSLEDKYVKKQYEVTYKIYFSEEMYLLLKLSEPYKILQRSKNFWIILRNKFQLMLFYNFSLKVGVGYYKML